MQKKQKKNPNLSILKKHKIKIKNNQNNNASL